MQKNLHPLYIWAAGQDTVLSASVFIHTCIHIVKSLLYLVMCMSTNSLCSCDISPHCGHHECDPFFPSLLLAYCCPYVFPLVFMDLTLCGRWDVATFFIVLVQDCSICPNVFSLPQWSATNCCMLLHTYCYYIALLWLDLARLLELWFVFCIPCMAGFPRMPFF